jgi:hypothetical protein
VSAVSVRRAVTLDGRCSACHQPAWVQVTLGRQLVVRLCLDCWQSLKAQARQR